MRSICDLILLNRVRELWEFRRRGAPSATRATRWNEPDNTAEQIVRKRHQAATELVAGKIIEEVPQSLAIPPATSPVGPSSLAAGRT